MTDDSRWDEPAPGHPVRWGLSGLRDRLSARVADMNVRTILDTLEIHFPPLARLHDYAQQTYLRARRQPFDNNFECLGRIELAPDEVMIDIGASRGQSIDAVRLYHPGASIIAFEPNPGLAAKLRTRFEDDRRLVIHNVGLGDAAGEFTLYVPCYNNVDFDGDGALVFGEHQWSHIRESVIGFDESQLSYKKMRCQVWQLDRFRLKARFIKIDTAGFELNVLRGAIETIQAHRPVLLVANTSPPDVISLLAPMGYGAFHFEGTLRHGQGSRNTLYIHVGEPA